MKDCLHLIKYTHLEIHPVMFFTEHNGGEPSK